MRPTFTESQRKHLLGAWQRSRTSAKAFCEGRNFHPTTLYGWLRRYGSTAEPIRVGLVEAVPTPERPNSAPAPSWRWELVGPGGSLRGADLRLSELRVLVEVVTRRGR